LSEFLIENIGVLSLQLEKQFVSKTAVKMSAEKVHPGYKGTENFAAD